MIKAIVCVSLLSVIVSAGSPRGLGLRPLGLAVAPVGGLLTPAAEPFNFGFNAADEYGTQWSRQEQSDVNGAVKGSYGYKDASGIYRTVEYVADDINGFRASVQSNEPGLISSAPAGVNYQVAGSKK